MKRSRDGGHERRFHLRDLLFGSLSVGRRGREEHMEAGRAAASVPAVLRVRETTRICERQPRVSGGTRGL